MATGKPNCRSCNGRGGWQGYRGWIACPCTKGSKETARIYRKIRADYYGRKQLTMDQMLDMGSTSTEGDDG